MKVTNALDYGQLSSLNKEKLVISATATFKDRIYAKNFLLSHVIRQQTGFSNGGLVGEGAESLKGMYGEGANRSFRKKKPFPQQK